PTTCGVLVSGSGLPSAWPGRRGAAVLTATGALPSTFSVSTPAAPTGSLCPSLNLTITGADSLTPYVSQTGIAAISATPLYTSTGSTAWAQTNSNSLTSHVAPETGFGTDNSVPGESCNFNVLSPQSA